MVWEVTQRLVPSMSGGSMTANHLEHEIDKMLAFDALEQLDADPLQLIAANARRDRSPHRIEIGFEKAVGKGAHGEPRHLAVLEHDRGLLH